MSNANNVIDSFRTVQRDIDANVKIALETIGQDAVGILKRNSPVLTGQLRASMNYEVENKTVIAGTNVEYAPSVEFKAKNGSQGYFLRAYNETVPRAKLIFKRILGV